MLKNKVPKTFFLVSIIMIHIGEMFTWITVWVWNNEDVEFVVFVTIIIIGNVIALFPNTSIRIVKFHQIIQVQHLEKETKKLLLSVRQTQARHFRRNHDTNRWSHLKIMIRIWWNIFTAIIFNIYKPNTCLN